MTYQSYSATVFTKNFADMRKIIDYDGIVLVKSHNKTIGAFVRPEIIEELEALRRKDRESKTLKDKHDEFFEGLTQVAQHWE